MNAEVIRERLRQTPFEPFEPFEVVSSAGQVHLVKHPEFAILLPSRMVITDPTEDRVAIISLIHIAELRTPVRADR